MFSLLSFMCSNNNEGCASLLFLLHFNPKFNILGNTPFGGKLDEIDSKINTVCLVWRQQFASLQRVIYWIISGHQQSQGTVILSGGIILIFQFKTLWNVFIIYCSNLLESCSNFELRCFYRKTCTFFKRSNGFWLLRHEIIGQIKCQLAACVTPRSWSRYTGLIKETLHQ